MKPTSIFIDKKGRWFQDGVPITHRWTYLENNRNLRKSSGGGGFEVAEGGVVIPVEVEDTPFVIVSAELAADGIRATVNDETTEILTARSGLSVSLDNIPYALIKRGEFKARFLSGAYYSIASSARPLEGGGFVIEFAGERYEFFPQA